MKPIKNLPQKSWWYCDKCEQTIKDIYPFNTEIGPICGIPDKKSCPRYLLNKYRNRNK